MASVDPSSGRLAYDVCLSYASEQSGYVTKVAEDLRSHGVRVYFDRFATEQLWGADLYQHLSQVYSEEARYCVVFVSKAYERKLYTRHELRMAQARAIKEKNVYVLPARFDDTVLPGLPSTVAHVDLRSTSPAELSALIRKKLDLPVEPPDPRPWPRTPLLVLGAVLAVLLVAVTLWKINSDDGSSDDATSEAPATLEEATGEIAEPAPGAEVKSCAYFAGTAALPPDTTLVLLKSNISAGGGTRYVETIFGWDEPTKNARRWRGAQYFGDGSESAGQRYRIELMVVDLDTAVAAIRTRQDDLINGLAGQGRVLDTISVERVPGQAKDDCPGPA
ncbi:TIR domain-containing protein [Cryptosporangium japonicum]|uniref:TIR domain-containing protein n=1 Tax=Cryptosporangium japonicum TaxID=80872 RepID=A0ABN0V463_9ACTN